MTEVLEGKYIYILDNDVVVGKDALRPLVSVMEKDRIIGFAAGKVYEWGTKKFQILYGKIDPITFHVEKVGGMDERCFIYFDDIDLFLSCKNAGFRIVYVPHARAWHKESSSLGQNNPQSFYYLQRNKILIQGKFRPFTVGDHLKQMKFFLPLCVSWVSTEKKRHGWSFEQ